MTTIFRNISISHQSATSQEREKYYLSDQLRRTCSLQIRRSFSDIKGLLIASTCNRTEIYFESTTTTSNEIRDFLIHKMNTNADLIHEQSLFHQNDRTADTTFHLLQVANGLRSAVIGDGQILAQIKEAYHLSFQQNTQGSIMERSIQAVFRSHKRISNETAFRNGSKSTSYRALKMIEMHFGKKHLTQKKLLLLGAGKIIIEVLRYLPKFQLQEVYISNRTEKKATELANTYGFKTLPWNQVMDQKLDTFDAIITAVSHRKNLIHIVNAAQKTVIIDLAMPSNVHPKIGFQENVQLHNIDAITEQISQTNHEQKDVIFAVNQIIEEEIEIFFNWLKKSDFRKLLSNYKTSIKQSIDASIKQTFLQKNNQEELEQVSEHIAQNLVKKTAQRLNSALKGEFSESNLTVIKKILES